MIVVKLALPDADIVMEGYIGSAPKRKKFDMKVTHPLINASITDVHLAQPSYSSYTRDHSGSRVEDAANTQGERMKTSAYGEFLRANVNPIEFVPFVLESSGRVGPKAVEFLKKIERVSACSANSLRSEIQSICLKYIGRLSYTSLRRLKNRPVSATATYK